MQNLELAVSIAKKAGGIILEYFNSDAQQASLKADNTIVTNADLEVNKMVIEEIQKHTDGHGVIGEEQSLETDSQYQWVVDPIDGTTMFSFGIPTNVFALALTKDKQPVLAVVFDPYVDKLYIADEKNVTCNNQPIQCNTTPLNQDSQIYIGLCANQSVDFNLYEVARRLSNDYAVKFISLRSAIYMDMLVASGKLSANLSYGGHGYDCIGGHIVKMAGGQYSDLNGEAINLLGENQGYFSSNGIIHAPILEIIKSCK